MIIIYTSKFEKEYRSLPQSIKDLASEKESLFRKNPFDKSLNTHKLKGKLKEYWSWSIDYKYRIIFWLKNSKEVWFLSVGNHDIYT
jgi:mRNA-degrading endonuclease YafQ of YafQ-DinJ toxin-antitoxin module